MGHLFPLVISNNNSQKSFVNHQKAMSISNSNSMSSKMAFLAGNHSTKQGPDLRKMNNEIRNNLIKRYMKGKNHDDSHTSSGGIMELSTRTPDKTNPEMSPYMIMNLQRTSSNNSSTHKKSKSQTSISGIKSMDNRGNPTQSEGNIAKKDALIWKNGNVKHVTKKSLIPNHKRHFTEPKVAVITIPKNIYNTYHSKKAKQGVNRRVEKRKKSIQHDGGETSVRINRSKERHPEGQVKYSKLVSRSKCHSKKKTSKVFESKSNSLAFHVEPKNTMRSGRREGEERRSASTIGFYMTERGQNNQSTGYNRYIMNNYPASITNSKTKFK